MANPLGGVGLSDMIDIAEITLLLSFHILDQSTEIWAAYSVTVLSRADLSFNFDALVSTQFTTQ